LLNGKNPPATDYLGIAEAYEALNKIESAVFYLNLGIDLVDKDRWKLLEKLGQFYLRDMKFEEAEHVFRKMTFEEQGKAEGFYQLGLLYLKQGDKESAFDVLKESEAHFHEFASLCWTNTVDMLEVVEDVEGVFLLCSFR
jgi:tetratricopeptide (TPR) repeat protein